MFLFRASGATYPRVVRLGKHAFPLSPAEVQGDEFVLLSKNKEDCALTERQIQYVAKVLAVRPAHSGELEGDFPLQDADTRWKYVVELYWTRALERPFSLNEVPGLTFKRYDTVQGFALLEPSDARAALAFLMDTNGRVLLDVVNNAARP